MVPNGRFRQRIIDEADNVARLYLEGKRLGQPATREQKEIIEGILAADYEGRTLVELLQNGHDAHDPGRTDGMLEFWLREDEGEHGVLYVANAGEPLKDEDFTALCRIAMSPKRPDQGIGNKGVGFKSVLQLARAPEIYSAADARGGQFDGYCFRFARPEDYAVLAERVAPGQAGLEDELRTNVASLKIPVPLETVPDEVASFAARGFITVIRLVLRSSAAQERAASQFAELGSSHVPFHLFLERISTITLRTSGNDAPDTIRTLSRSARRRPGPGVVPVDEVSLEDGTSYLVLRRTVPESAMKEAIGRSRHEGGLGSGWDDWQGEGTVSVALPTENVLPAGRLYAFLPMGRSAAAPLAALVNAPFVAHLDRRSIEWTVPLNEMLIGEVAALCAQAAVLAARGELALPDRVLLDVACWEEADLHLLAAATAELGEDLAVLPVLPPVLGDEERVTAAKGWLWQSTGTVFHAEAAARAGVPGLIDPGLGSDRDRRLSGLARFLKIRLVVGDVEIAGFAEMCAAALAAAAEQDWEAWAQFYDDLSVVMTDGGKLRGRRIIIDSRARLVAAADGTDGSATVFIATAQGDDDDVTVTPPDAVGRRVVFTAPAIPWVGADRRIRPGRGWLERHRLVQEYRTEPVLMLIGEVMRDPATTGGELDACLRFAFELWRGARRPVSKDTLRQARLVLPTSSGWLPASSTYFRPGWGGAHADTDQALDRLLARTGGASAELSAIGSAILLPAVDVLEAGDDDGQRRRFAEQLGAHHGLYPLWERARPYHLTGYQITNPSVVPHLPIDVSRRTQRAWLKLAARWPRQQPEFTGVTYTPTTGIAKLPGQEDFDSLEPEARRLYAELILRGLGTWPDTALQYTYARSTDARRPTWPTLLAAFLSTAAWIPQTAPRDRSRISYEPCSTAWWLREAETPGYLPAQPPSFRALATPLVLARLEKIGVRFWDDPRSSGDRLRHLTNLIGEGAERWGSLIFAIRKAYETAWQDLIDTSGSPPEQVIVVRQGQPLVADLPSADTIYVPDPDGATRERLLAQAPVLMLAIRDARLAARARQQLDTDGRSGLRSTADTQVEVTVDDGQPAAQVPGQPLHRYGGSWLPLLILAVLEYQYRGFPAIHSAQLTETARLLNQLDVVTATTMTTTIDGHQIRPEDLPQSLLAGTPDTPRVVVTSARDTDRWAVLEAASPALMDLAGVPDLTASLQIALVKLQRACGNADPTPADLAAALSIPAHEISALAADRGLWRTKLTSLVAVLACIDVDLAEQFRAEADGLDNPDAVHDWLAAHLTSHTPETLMMLADQDDLRGALHELGIPLETANLGLRALGLPPLHNPDGHARQLSAYLQQNRPARQNTIRDRFALTYHPGEPLTEYLTLLEAVPKPDPAWLDRYWDLPPDVLASYVDSWLEQACPIGDDTQPVKTLAAIDELREAGARTITSVLPNARTLAEAWLHRNSAGEGARPGGRAAVTGAMIAEGLLDFGRLTAADVIRWLHRNGQWPDGMPMTTNRADLRLTEQDLEGARSRLEQRQEQQRRKATYVQYGNHTYSEESSDLQALVDAARENVPAAVLATPAEPIKLPELAADTGGSRARPRTGSGGMSWTSRPPAEKLKAIGLAGEAVVGEWLRTQFGLPPEDTWVSGYRAEILADGKGSDSLGYDFIVKTHDRTWLFEVKATTEETPEFALGESEVRRARDVSSDEEYVIVFVTHVLSPEKRRIHPLPNPLGPGGLQYYRVAGRALRLQFDLHET